MRFAALLVLLAVVGICQPLKAQDIKTLLKGYHVAFNEGFGDKSKSNFIFSDSTRWLITKNGTPGKDIKCTSPKTDLTVASHPTQYAIIKDVMAGDFVMEFDFMQKGRDFTLRDLCVLFAFKDSANYSFVQVASEETKLSHNVFVPQAGSWRKVGKATNKGFVWAYEKWHAIRVVRQTLNHTLELYIDNNLIVSTNADTDGIGQLGIGTYGNDFKIDNLKVWLPAMK